MHAEKRNDPTRAMKVLWRDVDDPGEMLQQQSTTLEEVVLPAMVFKSLMEALESSQLVLPASARTFQDWHVGLLQRFKDAVG